MSIFVIYKIKKVNNNVSNNKIVRPERMRMVPRNYDNVCLVEKSQNGKIRAVGGERWQIKNRKVWTGVKKGARVRKEELEELEKCGQDENGFWVSW